MQDRFEVRLNEKEYLDFNAFQYTKSHYGKKRVRSFRMAFLLAGVFGLLVMLWVGGTFSKVTIGIILALDIALVILTPKYLGWAVKGEIKQMKKTGKLPYTPWSILEFYEDHFVETSEDQKIAVKYSAVERISVVDRKTIYLHTSTAQAFILTGTAFASQETFENLLRFLETKCSQVDFY